jgi:hypothetical protein
MNVSARITSVVTRLPLRAAFALAALAALTCVVALTAAPAAAQTPIANIPVFQGATLDPAAARVVQAEREGVDDLAAGHPGKPTSRVTQVYSTTTGLEDVLAYYIKALNARPWGDSGPDEPATVKRGGASRPAWQADPYEEELQDARAEATGEVMRQGAWVRKVLSGRKPVNGQWMGTGLFAWSARDNDGAVTMFRVVLQDRSFDKDGGKSSKTRDYSQKTYILIESASWK